MVLTRVLLHKPHLLVIDEALDALDDDTLNRVLRLLNDELKDASVINAPRPRATSLRAFCIWSKIPRAGLLLAQSQSRLLIRRLTRFPSSRRRFPSYLCCSALHLTHTQETLNTCASDT